jgi:hypothetical protein
VGGGDGLGAGRWTWAEGNHVCASAVVLGTEVANKRVILTLALLRNLQRLVAESCGPRSSSSGCVSSKQITSIALICRSLLGRSRHSAFVLRIMLKASHRAFPSNQPSMRVIHIPLYRVSQWVAPRTQGDQVEQQTWRGVASSRTDGPNVPYCDIGGSTPSRSNTRMHAHTNTTSAQGQVVQGPRQDLQRHTEPSAHTLCTARHTRYG